MTAAKFYQLLEEAGDRMVWFVTSNGKIRGRFRRAKVKRCFCPITAVRYLQSNCRDFYETGEVLDANSRLGLNEHFMYNVYTASDNHGSKKVRRHIKSVLGL